MMAPGRTNFRMSSQLALEPGLRCSMSWIYTSAACGLVCLSPDLVVTVKFISPYCTSVTVLESRRRRSLSPRWSLHSLSSVVCRFLPGRCRHCSSLTLVITDQWLLGSWLARPPDPNSHLGQFCDEDCAAEGSDATSLSRIDASFVIASNQAAASVFWESPVLTNAAPG